MIVINSAVTGGHKTLVVMEKQTNKTDEIKWWKYVQRLITDANCFRVGGENRQPWRGAVHVREGKRNLRISSLCVWPAPDFRAKPSLSREGQHQVQLFTSAAWENTLNTKDYTTVRCNIAWPTLQNRSTQHISKPQFNNAFFDAI